VLVLERLHPHHDGAIAGGVVGKLVETAVDGAEVAVDVDEVVGTG
jgi:hypothetical protein